MPRKHQGGAVAQQTRGPRGVSCIRLETLHEDAPSCAARLFLSGEAFAMQSEQMRALGVRSVLAIGCRAHFPNDFDYLELHCRDDRSAQVGRYLDRACAFIDSALRAAKPVLVHCKAGICRSPTMVIAYLLRHRRDLAPSLAHALVLVREARPSARPRPEFMSALAQFDHRTRAWEDRDAGLDEGDDEHEDSGGGDGDDEGLLDGGGPAEGVVRKAATSECSLPLPIDRGPTEILSR
jgi:predicted protein tyrosine phosphatase